MQTCFSLSRARNPNRTSLHYDKEQYRTTQDKKRKNNTKMGKPIETKNRLTPEQAARELNMATDSFRQCLIHNAFPIQVGIAVLKPGNKNFTYYVYREPLNKLKQLWGIE